MDYREQKALLRKYWAAESSLEEEKRLKAFFRDAPPQMDAELMAAAPLFRLLDQEAAKAHPEFEGPWRTSRLSRGRRIRRMRHYWEYAALCALILGSLWMAAPGTRTGAPVASQREVIQDPDAAWKTTRQALEVIAANLNKGKDQMKKLAVFHEAQEVIGTSR